MALDTTVGGVSTNSYVTVEEADAYFLDRMHSEVWGASVPKAQVLISSSRMLDWYLKFKGYKTDPAQAMQWPRTGVVLPDSVGVADDVIPPLVKMAVFELALVAVEEDPSLDNDLAGLAQVQAGPLMIKTSQGIRPKAKSAIPDRVKAMLRDYLLNSGIRVVWLERA